MRLFGTLIKINRLLELHYIKLILTHIVLYISPKLYMSIFERTHISLSNCIGLNVEIDIKQFFVVVLVFVFQHATKYISCPLINYTHSSNQQLVCIWGIM